MAGQLTRWQGLSARARRRVVWELLTRSARRRGIDPAALARVEEFLSHSFRLREARPAYPMQRPRNFFPGLSTKPWYDATEFEWAQRLEASFEMVRDEVATVRKSNLISGDASQGDGSAAATRAHPDDIPVEGQWDVFYFHVIGRRHEQNHVLCPQTSALLDSISDLCACGISYFSILQAGTHITPHTAPNNLRIRGMLGIETPAEGRFRVGTEIRNWQEGRCLIFDGSFEHEVWASPHGDRTVLIVDTWHPGLTPEERWALTELNRYSRETRRYWKETLSVSAEQASAAQARAA